MAIEVEQMQLVIESLYDLLDDDLVDDSGLIHRDPERTYDPAKAHAYYMRTRKLKGRKTKTAELGTPENPIKIKNNDTIKTASSDDLVYYEERIRQALKAGKNEKTGKPLTEKEIAEGKKFLSDVDKEINKRTATELKAYRSSIKKAKTPDLKKFIKQIDTALKKKKTSFGQKLTVRNVKDLTTVKSFVNDELKRRDSND